MTNSKDQNSPGYTVAPLHKHEDARLAALDSLGILNTREETRFDRITSLVSQVLGFPIVLVSLIEENRQWFKSHCGIGVRETSRDIAFCAHAINQDSGELLIPDTMKDPRFAGNPLVTDEPHIRAYAGIVLKSPSKLPLGTLCVIDQKPRQYTTELVKSLRLFAELIEKELYDQVSGTRAPVAEEATDPPEHPIGMPVRDFVEATEAALADNASPMVFGCVSLPKNTNIEKTYGGKVLRECRAELARRLRLSLTGRKYYLGYCADSAFNFICSNDSADGTIDGLVADLDVNIGQRFQTSTRTVMTSVAVGLTLIDQGETDFHSISSRADTALQDATTNRTLGANISVYNAKMQDRIERSKSLALGLEDAIEAKEITIHFQPKVRLSDYKIVGVEALVRWKSEAFGQVPPNEIIDAAMDTDTLLELELYIMHMALEHAHLLRKDFGFNETVSINICETTLMAPEFFDAIRSTLKKYPLPPGTIDIEILESTMLQNVNATISRIRSLKDLGITFSLDDFGTGYSSLSHLNNLPIDFLKIDRSFVQRVIDDRKASEMVHQIIRIGHTINAVVIAEGVETFDQYLILRSIGCDIIQGYYFARPIPFPDLTDILRSQKGFLPPKQVRSQSLSIEAIDVIRSVPIFASLTPQEQMQLARESTHRLFHPGDDIIIQGEVGTSLFILISGEVDVSRQTTAGDFVKLTKLANNDIFGEFAVLTNSPRFASITARTESLVLEVNKKSILPILSARPQLADKFTTLMEERREISEALVSKVG